MSYQIRVYKSDNSNTRHAKRSHRRKLRSRRKSVGRYSGLKQEKRKEKSKARKKRQFFNSPIQYNQEINEFCTLNNIHEWDVHPKKIDLTADFSLFNNPAKVLGSLLNILYLAKTKSEFVTLNYKGAFSFGALYFIDTICWQIGSKRKWQLRHNNLPPKERTILQNLRSIQTTTSETEYAYIINNRIRINRAEDDLARQQHKAKSKEIRDLIIKGIKENFDQEYELTHPEHTAIDSAISEHFDNILLHVPNAEYGFLCGSFDKVKKEVTILIYNFGNTISETLDKKNLPQHVQVVVDKIIENYARNIMFWKHTFTRENALTLLAIQEGISSKLDADITRGHGLIDFIEHCFELNSESRIVIISGKTAIKVDSTYKISSQNVFGRTRRILAFNDENDIFKKPDERNVINLPVFFNGTIIETTIPLKIDANHD